jgi:hypothetical protein
LAASAAGRFVEYYKGGLGQGCVPKKEQRERNERKVGEGHEGFAIEVKLCGMTYQI